MTDQFKAICEQYCRDADMVIHLGDWTRSAILDYLEQYPLQAVAGNMDDYSVHSRLPVKKVIQVNGFRIGMIHGWGSARDLRNRLKTQFADVHAIFFGHTHQPLQSEENGLFWFNPGSVFTGAGRFEAVSEWFMSTSNCAVKLSSYRMRLMENLWAPWRMEYILGKREPYCIFCPEGDGHTDE